jgi:hypothetical protein
MAHVAHCSTDGKPLVGAIFEDRVLLIIEYSSLFSRFDSVFRVDLGGRVGGWR